MNFIYCCVKLTLFSIDSALDSPPRYTFFLYEFSYLFIYLSIHLYICGVMLYYYCLSLVYIDRLAKSHIFLNLFSRDSTLGV